MPFANMAAGEISEEVPLRARPGSRPAATGAATPAHQFPCGRRSRGHAVEVDERPRRSRRGVTAALACVMALGAADLGTIGALAPTLGESLGIGNTEIGLLRTVTALIGTLASLPAGILADRTTRVRLLAVSVSLWAVAMTAAAMAHSFGWLLVARVALGVVTGAAGPLIASLVGDYFPMMGRGAVYGRILVGEIVGGGVGLLMAGYVADAVSWRWALVALAVPTVPLACWVAILPEPARGGTDRLPDPESAPMATRPSPLRREGPDPGGGTTRSSEPQPGASERGQRGGAGATIHARGGSPEPDRVLQTDVASMSLVSAARHVLRVRTNLVLIVASAVGYYFFAGLQTFATTFLHQRHGLSQSGAVTLLVLASIAGVAGVLTGGRLADRLLARGRTTSRIQVGMGAYFLAIVALVPAIIVPTLAVTTVLLAVASVGLGAANPPLDAARLDIMPAPLWGRAEAIRGIARTAGDAAAPLLFGLLADTLDGPGGQGLEKAFLIMLVPLVTAGLVGLLALRTYPGDVAAAAAYHHRPGGHRDGGRM